MSRPCPVPQVRPQTVPRASCAGTTSTFVVSAFRAVFFFEVFFFGIEGIPCAARGNGHAE